MRYYVLLLTVSFFTRFPSLFIRVIDADEAVYANTARGILRGLLPYRDLIDQKPPFIYYFYAFFLGIINDLRFLHAITIIIVWLTAIVVYRLVTCCFDKHSGVVAGILYAAFVSTVGYSSNTEIFMNLPLVLGVWFFHLGGVTNQVSDSCEVRSLGAPSRCSRVVQPRDTFEESLAELVPPRRSLFTVLAAGFFIGVACLIKQQAVIVMVPLCLMIIVSRFKPVIASVARRSRFKDEKRDCFGAKAPRNDKWALAIRYRFLWH